MKVTHYYTVVPWWLTQVLNTNGVSLTQAVSYEALSATVSKEDVAFYHALQAKASDYVGSYFDDMTSIYHRPDNQQWLSANQRLVERVLVQFESAFKSNLDKLTTVEVPQVIRRTAYCAKPLDSDTLALIGCGDYVSHNHASFISECVQALNQQMSYDRYKHFKVFGQFTQIAQ